MGREKWGHSGDQLLGYPGNFMGGDNLISFLVLLVAVFSNMFIKDGCLLKPMP